MGGGAPFLTLLLSPHAQKKLYVSSGKAAVDGLRHCLRRNRLWSCSNMFVIGPA